MLKFIKHGTTPPDLFHFRFSQDQYLSKAFDYDAWIADIRKHAVDNAYPIPTNEEAEDQMCRTLSGEWCSGGGPYSFVNTRFTLNDFLHGTKVLASFVLSGQVVSPEIAEQRALICSRCPLNVRVPGCASCSGMANAVADAKGKQSTKYDYLLQACSICLCSNEAQIWLPIKYLRKGVTNVMMAQFEDFAKNNECWKASELKEFEAEKENSAARTS